MLLHDLHHVMKHLYFLKEELWDGYITTCIRLKVFESVCTILYLNLWDLPICGSQSFAQISNMASENFITSQSLWNREAILPLFKGLRLSKNWIKSYSPSKEDPTDIAPGNEDNILQPLTDLTVATKMTCSVCKTAFKSRQEQVLHYKSDWHCENLRRKKQGLQPVTEGVTDLSCRNDQINEESLLDDLESSDSMSSAASTSSSDTDNEQSNAKTECKGQRHAKLFFENESGEIFSVYKCLILSRKETLPNEDEIEERVKNLPQHTSWAIILLGGGHFAAGIFKEHEVIVHKTFHRYITRAKQGTTQSIYDQHSKNAKSAGANLRRHNEMALVEEINALLLSWSDYLNDCSHIFYRAAGRNVRALCGKKKPLFLKEDVRLRNIPFPTNKASFQEVVKVHTKLSTILCHGRGFECGNKNQFSTSTSSSPKKFSNTEAVVETDKTKDLQYVIKSNNVVENSQTLKDNCSKCASPSETEHHKCDKKRRLKHHKMAKREQFSDSGRKAHQETPLHSRSTSCDSSDGNIIVEFEDEVIDTSSLRLFETTTSKVKKNNTSFKNATMHEKITSSISFDKEEQRLHNSLYTACTVNDISTVQRLLQPLKEKEPTKEVIDNQNNTQSPETILQALNSPFGRTKSSLLHIVSQCGFHELLWLLLESGADPSITDIKGRPPYVLAVNKDTRNSFRRFMSAYPEKYDYVKTQIPSPLSDVMEQAQMQRIQQHRQQKRQRAKARQANEQEKAGFLKLTDSEKKTYITNAPAKLRCFLCGKVLELKTMFEYNNFKFCTIKCLQQHRKNN